MVSKIFYFHPEPWGFMIQLVWRTLHWERPFSHWERLCNFQGNDAVEVGIVPVSEVEENELNESLVGKGPGQSSKDIKRYHSHNMVGESTNTKNESKACITYCSIFIYHTIRIYKDGIGFVMF